MRSGLEPGRACAWGPSGFLQTSVVHMPVRNPSVGYRPSGARCCVDNAWIWRKGSEASWGFKDKGALDDLLRFEVEILLPQRWGPLARVSPSLSRGLGS